MNPHDDSGPAPLPSEARRKTSGFAWGLRAAMAVAALSVLVWSWRDAEMNPVLLIERAPRAREYIFGREITDAARVDAEAQAERLTDLGIRRDVENQVMRELGVERGGVLPADFEERVDAAMVDRKASMDQDSYGDMVDVRRRQILRQSSGGYFPPETGAENLKMYGTALLETVAIAVWGTLIAFVLAVPAAVFGAARSMDILVPGENRPSRLVRMSAIFTTRRLFDFCRGFNEFVLALILVAIVGLGPFAGVMALAVHTFGVLGKVISEAIETAKTGEIEGVAATGAGSVQIVSYSVLPQIMPFIVSQSLLRFESNVRSASVLGLVGAGGIGFLIDAKLKAYKFTEVATIMILVIIAVTLIDFACSRIMKKVV